ncbi:hypothetical protein HBH73_255170 [Parastagonospora nodorum]|nr:hypothetical protein HBH73_255170 [Parastagonospora nodorum]
MDGLSGASSVIAVIDISTKIALLCFQYSTAVKDTKDDIERVQRKVGDITHILEKIKQLLDSQDKALLSTTQDLFSSLEQCREELKSLEAKLAPGKTRKTMSRFGFRALKWPFTSKQVNKVVLNLERHEQTFSLALQVDQTAVVFSIDQKLDLAKLPIAIGASVNSHNEEHNARAARRDHNMGEQQGWQFYILTERHGGHGKSTIARTVAQSFASRGQLGASFFFKKGERERGNASRFFTTIATDLVACKPGMLPGIRKTLNEDPAISHKALKDQFEKLILQPLLGIKQTQRMLASDWPAQQQILALVELAVPLFIYATTVCRYVGSKGSNPTTFLNKVLQYQKATFSQLDRTYPPVLYQLLNERETWLQAFREVVGSIVVLESPLSATSLARLLQVPQEEIQCRRDPLHSVLSVLDKKDAPIRLLHLSFREFLLDHQKQGKSPFWVDEKRTHQKLVSRCLKLMSRSGGLHQNMCGLPGPGLLRSEVDEQIVATRLPPDLQYACRYWVDHLKQSGQGIVDGDATHLFLQKHLLYWLEAMSLVRESSRCVNLLDSLRVLASVRFLQNTLLMLH